MPFKCIFADFRVLTHKNFDLWPQSLQFLASGWLCSKQLSQVKIHRNGILFGIFRLTWFKEFEAVLLKERDGQTKKKK